MKKVLKNKKVWIVATVCIILIIVVALLFGKEDNNLKSIEGAIENVFFYLPEEKYDNLNDIPDYCKISLVYGTDFVKVDTYLSTEDYETESSKKGKNTIEAYHINNVEKGLRNLIGIDATIELEKDDEGEYQNLIENGCGYNNPKIDTLGYNNLKGYIFSNDYNEDKNEKLYVNWNTPIIDGNKVTLKAKALLAVEKEDGSYEVFADGGKTLKAGEIEKNKNVEKEINDMFDYASREYIFTLKKQKNKYIWTKYKVVDDVYSEKIIYD